MIIRSNFVDYYDCMQSYGDDLVYIRYPEIMQESKPNKWRQYPVDWFEDAIDMSLDQFYLGFCGKIYNIVRERASRQCFYSLEALDSFMATQKDSIAEWNRSWGSRRNYREFFNDGYESHYRGLFDEYHSPIFLVYPDDRIVKDCGIKKMGFFRQMDVVQTWQELEMYVSNMHKPDIQPPQPDDITMRDIKGFDKYSFKKSKSK